MKKENHYILYIDDSGSRFPDSKEIPRNDGMDCFALGGILILERDLEHFVQNYKEFCVKYNITYPLHSTKIRGYRDNFSWLKNDVKKTDNFLNDLENLMIEIPAIGFASVVDRKGYNLRYRDQYDGQPWWMCKTAYSTLIERVAKFVISNDGTFEIHFERVGPKEDKSIIEYTKDLKNIGMPFDKRNMEKYESLTKEEFKSTLLGEPHRKTKNDIFIQVADLYLYPMIKGKFDELFRPWTVLLLNKKVINALLDESKKAKLGIKYSCFDTSESKNPEMNSE